MIGGHGYTIRTDAKKHGVGKTDNAGVAQQQVETGHQDDKDQNLGCYGQGFDTRK